MPIRIRRQRASGWRMPPNAVYVGRPTKWGNPWIAGNPGSVHVTLRGQKMELLCPRSISHSCAVDIYSAWLRDGLHALGDEFLPKTRTTPQGLAMLDLGSRRDEIILSLPTLRGKDLVCWCPIVSPKPCHADVLLEMANSKYEAWMPTEIEELLK